MTETALTCHNGRHPSTPENIASDGRCRVCDREAQRARRAALASLPLRRPPDWMDYAACLEVDPGDVFYAEKGRSDLVQIAKRICSFCPVQAECLEWALDHDEHYGVWGGLSERERRRLKRRSA